MRGPQDDEDQRLSLLLQELDGICGSDALSFDILREIVDVAIPYARTAIMIPVTPLLHRACVNRRVTLEIIECILDVFPELVRRRSLVFCPMLNVGAYPLHIACCNPYCPSSVIELLVRRYPPALDCWCMFDEKIDGNIYASMEEWTPLQYYLGRERNVDLATVKMLVGASNREDSIATESTEDDMPRSSPLHVILSNSHVDGVYDIVQYIIEADPTLLLAEDMSLNIPIHIACANGSIDAATIKALLDACEESTTKRDAYGELPIHIFCKNWEIGEVASLDILKLLIEKDPLTVREQNQDGFLPIYYAASSKTPAFCKVLVDVYQESLLNSSVDLPIHQSCRAGNFDTVKFLHNACPESIHARNDRGYLPIHSAASERGSNKIKVLKYLLQYYPDAATDSRLVELSCDKLDAAQLLFDEHPTAFVGYDETKGAPEVINFVKTQLAHACALKEASELTIPDCDGMLPLHRALVSNASLGAIKLLVKRNPSALSCSDLRKNYPLHYACREGNCKAVNHLLQKNASPLCERNVDGKLPVQLLCELGEHNDTEEGSPNFVETVWYLLREHPESVMKCD